MPKLIACDIDGTLIPYGQSRLPDALFPLLHRLRSAGILFCPASGRQFHSLRGLFAPAAEELCFLCENGAILYGPGREDTAPVLGKTPIPRGEAAALARDILALEGCQLLVSGANVSYVSHCPQSYIDYMAGDKGNNVQVIERLEDIPEDIIKVSVYCPGGTAAPQRLLGPRWGHLGMAAAGSDWVDFTLADKGTGIRDLCAALGLDPQTDVWAFGDNWNDKPMLEAVGTPWLMESADPALKRLFPRHCASVLVQLETLLDQAER